LGFVDSRIWVVKPGLGKPRLEESHMGVCCRTQMAGELQMVPGRKSQSLWLPRPLSGRVDL